MTQKIRRNTVIMEHGNVFPARVWKLLDGGYVLSIDCGLHVRKLHHSQFIVTNYKGRWVTGYNGKKYFLGMSRLRSLIKGAKQYNPELEPEEC